MLQKIILATGLPHMDGHRGAISASLTLFVNLGG